MSEALAEMFKFNLWANLRLLDACERLDDEQLGASAPGAYGPVRDTLVHMLAAEERYVTLLTSVSPEKPLRESDGWPGFEELTARAGRSGNALIEIARQFDYGQVLHGVRNGEPYEMRAIIPLVQATHHGNEHRTNVTTTLSQYGLEAPDVSVWAYRDYLTATVSAQSA